MIKISEIPSIPPITKEGLTPSRSPSSPYIQVVDLPSKFKPYPAGTVIEYSTYSWGEVKLLQQPNHSPVDMMNILAKGIRLNNDLTVHDLAVVDFYYISLLRRLSAEGEDCSWGRKAKCPCGKREIVTQFKATDISTSDLEAAVPIVIVSDGHVLNFNVLRMKALTPLGQVLSEKTHDPTIAISAFMVENYPFQEAYDILWNVKSENVIEAVNSARASLDFHIKPIEKKCGEFIDNAVCEKDVAFVAHLEVGHLRPFRFFKSNA